MLWYYCFCHCSLKSKYLTLFCLFVSECFILSIRSDPWWSYCCGWVQSCGNIRRFACQRRKARSCACHVRCWCCVCRFVFWEMLILRFVWTDRYRIEFLSGSFTTNVVAAAPVLYCQRTLDISNTVRDLFFPSLCYVVFSISSFIVYNYQCINFTIILTRKKVVKNKVSLIN